MDGLSIRNNPVNTGVVGTSAMNPTVKPSTATQDGSFADTLKDAVGKVNELQQESDMKMQQLATGETTDIADVKIAAEKAEIALRLMTSVRNKMIDAYHEIMKMQV